MTRCIVISDGSYRKADVEATAGDWAITVCDGVRALTHLPTGACVPGSKGKPREYLEPRLTALARLPRFDVQTLRHVREAIAAVMASPEVEAA